MKILPPRTRPPSSTIDRRHTPRPTVGRFGYQTYRACLRWEFGFTCAFCLLHESDFGEQGTEGLALTGIEHFDPVSAQGGVNDYENCFYSCRLCNGSRARARIVDRPGRRLLNSCLDVWADHFEATSDDCLRPRSGDVDAAYTHRIYDLDDRRKVALRQARRERIGEALEVLRDVPELLGLLLERIREQPSDLFALRVAELLSASIQRARSDLHRYAAIPKDANRACRCGRSDHHELPPGLAEQLIKV